MLAAHGEVASPHVHLKLSKVAPCKRQLSALRPHPDRKPHRTPVVSLETDRIHGFPSTLHHMMHVIRTALVDHSEPSIPRQQLVYSNLLRTTKQSRPFTRWRLEAAAFAARHHTHDTLVSIIIMHSPHHDSMMAAPVRFHAWRSHK